MKQAGETLASIFAKMREKRKAKRDVVRSEIGDIPIEKDEKSTDFDFFIENMPKSLTYFSDAVFQGHAIEWSKGDQAIKQFDCTLEAPNMGKTALKSILPQNWQQTQNDDDHRIDNRFTIDMSLNLAAPRNVFSMIISTLLEKNTELNGDPKVMEWLKQFNNVNDATAKKIFDNFTDSSPGGARSIAMLYKIDETHYGVDFFGLNDRQMLDTSVIVATRPNTYTMVHTEWNNAEAAKEAFIRISQPNYWDPINQMVDIIVSQQWSKNEISLVKSPDELVLLPDLDGKYQHEFSFGNARFTHPPDNLIHKDFRKHNPPAFKFSYNVGKYNVESESLFEFNKLVEETPTPLRYLEGWKAEPLTRPIIKLDFIKNAAIVE